MEVDVRCDWKTLLETKAKNFTLHNSFVGGSVGEVFSILEKTTVIDILDRSLDCIVGQEVYTWTDIVKLIHQKITNYFSCGINRYILVSEAPETVPQNLKKVVHPTPFDGHNFNPVFGDTGISSDTKIASHSDVLKRVLSTDNLKIRLISWVSKELLKKPVGVGKVLEIDCVNCYEMINSYNEDIKYVDYNLPLDSIYSEFVGNSNNNNNNNNKGSRTFSFVTYVCRTGLNESRNIVCITKSEFFGDAACRATRRLFVGVDVSEKETFLFLSNDTRQVFMLLHTIVDLISRNEGRAMKKIYLFDNDKVYNIVEMWRFLMINFSISEKYEIMNPVELVSFLYLLSRDGRFVTYKVTPEMIWNYVFRERSHHLEKSFDDMEIDQYGSNIGNENNKAPPHEAASLVIVDLVWGESRVFKTVDVSDESFLRLMRALFGFYSLKSSESGFYSATQSLVYVKKRCLWFLGYYINGCRPIEKGIAAPFVCDRDGPRWGWFWSKDNGGYPKLA